MHAGDDFEKVQKRYLQEAGADDIAAIALVSIRLVRRSTGYRSLPRVWK
jgi:hypothetical protein